MVTEVSPEQLKAQIDAGTAPLVIDVREAWELEISRLPIARHIPMGEIAARLGELDRAAPVTILCRSGGRSMTVARFLEQNGFKSVANLTGGILAWGERIDASLRPY
jgi:adenylyltransferase/sulfurtransferase